MARGDQVLRQWRLHQILEHARRGMSVEELRDAMDGRGSRRTIYRDLEVLISAGFPIRQDRGKFRMESGRAALSIPVSPSDLVAIVLAEDLVAPLAETAVAARLATVRTRLLAQLSPAGRAFIAELRRRSVASVFAPTTYRPHAEAIATIEHAILENQPLRLSYASSGRAAEEREVEPYATWFHQGRLYLIGWCRTREDWRTFAVQRIRSVEELDETFDVDASFDLAAFVRKGFGVYHGPVHHVVVDFAADVAYLAEERQYHPTQSLRRRADGTLRLTMDAAGIDEIAAWIAGFGGRIVPVAPPELVARVGEIFEGGLRALAATGRVPG